MGLTNARAREFSQRCLVGQASRGEDAMPFKVIFLKGKKEVETRKCETKTEAVAYANARQSVPLETVSAIIVDDDSNEIVFTSGQAREFRRAEALKACAASSLCEGRPRD